MMWLWISLVVLILIAIGAVIAWFVLDTQNKKTSWLSALMSGQSLATPTRPFLTEDEVPIQVRSPTYVVAPQNSPYWKFPSDFKPRNADGSTSNLLPLPSSSNDNIQQYGSQKYWSVTH